MLLRWWWWFVVKKMFSLGENCSLVNCTALLVLNAMIRIIIVLINDLHFYMSFLRSRLKLYYYATNSTTTNYYHPNSNSNSSSLNSKLMSRTKSNLNAFRRVVFFFVFTIFCQSASTLPRSLRVGIVIPEENRGGPAEIGYKFGLHVLNRRLDQRSIHPNVTLVPTTVYLKTGAESYRSAQQLCQLLESSGGISIVTIFGGSSEVDPSVESRLFWTASAMDIPLFLPSSSYSYYSTNDLNYYSSATKLPIPTQQLTQGVVEPLLSSNFDEIQFAIRPAPPISSWTLLLKDFLQYLKVEGSFALLYEEPKGLKKLQGLLKEPFLNIEQIMVRRLEPSNEGFAQVFAEIQNREIRHVAIDCRLESLPFFYSAVTTLHMTDYKNHFIFTNLDLATADLKDLIEANVNLTSFQIVDQDSNLLREMLKGAGISDEEDSFFSLVDKIRFNTINWQKENPHILTETALAFDSVMTLGTALANLDGAHNLKPPVNLSCSNNVPWPDGPSLLNYINSADYKGLTGQVSFRDGGERFGFRVDVMRLEHTGLKRVGTWTDLQQLRSTIVDLKNPTSPSPSPQDLYYKQRLNIFDHSVFWDNELSNVTLRVTAVLEIPYVKIRPESYLTGNDRFEGFSIDLLKAIAHHVGFKYTIEIVPDGKYGAYDSNTGEWNGVVKQLIDKQADLAVGAMTINYARESVIDFTKPFMNLGISILFKVPERPPASIFSFLKPLAFEIWISVLVSYVLVSITIFIVARFSPYEWSLKTAIITHHPVISESNPPGSLIDDNTDLDEPRIKSVGHIINQFSLSNSFWYPVGTLMQQGSDLNPRTASTRVIGGFWWFFCTVLISSYTANLAAFLTVERMSTPIESGDDLAEQSEIAYGTLHAGSTMTFFRDSKIETYQKMWRFMESRKPSVFVSTYKEGIKTVLEGNYAFLMESTMLDYAVQRNCNLTQIGGLLDTKGYGLATPIGSPWRDKISLAILEMQEKGIIQVYYNKWWRNPSGGHAGDMCNRDLKKQDSKASALGVDSIGGIFVFLLVGLTLAIMFALFEFCYKAKSVAQSDNVCSDMCREAKFAVIGPKRRPDFSSQCKKCNSNSISSLTGPPGRTASIHRHRNRHRKTSYHDFHTFPHQHHLIGNSIASVQLAIQ